jgi:NDP-sugar pyrophosphorylase family protein
MRSLEAAGWARIILPLGYRGAMIREFVESRMQGSSAEIVMLDTGVDTEIGARIAQVKPSLKSDRFLLLNGDAIFDFDLVGLWEKSGRGQSLATLLSVDIVSNFGVLVFRGEKLVGFERDLSFSNIMIGDGGGPQAGWGSIYSGMAVLNRKALDVAPIEHATNFETSLYPKLIAMGQADTLKIDGFWYAMDTPKDVDTANRDITRHGRSGVIGALREKFAKMSSRQKLHGT